VVNIVWNCFFLFVRRLADCLTFCSYVYEASSIVTGVISYLEEQRNSLIDLQERHGVKVWHIGGVSPLYYSINCCPCYWHSLWLSFSSTKFLLLFLFVPLHIDTLWNRRTVCWNGWSLGFRVDMEGDHDGLCNGWWRFSPSAQAHHRFTSPGILPSLRIKYNWCLLCIFYF
jgi:hypothetical protein